jgi:acetoin utilization protein AcuC
MVKPGAAFLHSLELEAFQYPPECPFSSQRAAMTRKTLESMGLLSGPGISVVAPAPASRSELESFHSARYLDALLAAQQGTLEADALGMGLGTPDCPVFGGMYDYAALACGATLAAAELLLCAKVDVAFNPSGGYHHAQPGAASGFCYLNDVVLGCMKLLDAGKKVLFLDVDVHHCDGVQDAFYRSSEVLTISLHQSGETLFPGTGRTADIGTAAGKGYSVNLPLPPGCDDQMYQHAFDEIVPALIGAFAPDVIVLELGMDALSGDPLAALRLTNNTYAHVVEEVLAFGKPLLATGGGGYNPDNTARGWALCWSIMSGADRGEDLGLGLGGAMLETTDWQGGLRDRELPPDFRARSDFEPVVLATLDEVRGSVFPLHGLEPERTDNQNESRQLLRS